MHNRTDVKPMFFLIPQERNYIFWKLKKKKDLLDRNISSGGSGVSGKVEMNRKEHRKSTELHFFLKTKHIKQLNKAIHNNPNPKKKWQDEI